MKIHGFYAQYHGHNIAHLQQVLKFQRDLKKRCVFLAGDSSLDSKYWFRDTAPAVNGFEQLLSPSSMKMDIAYFLNKAMADEKVDMFCLNTAIEESTLAERATSLMPQDQIICDSMQRDDVLFINVGGNDIALRPSVSTIFSMLLMLMTNDAESLKRGPSAVWGMSHFVWLFKDQITAYINKLTAKQIPSKIIVGMIYYPCMTPSGGWADRVLGYLKYYSNPALLQQAINQIYSHAICQINIPGTQVVPFPMFKYLDGTDPSCYCAGVEPSAIGNACLSRAVWPLIKGQQGVARVDDDNDASALSE